MSLRRPNFFIVGAPKCGTSSMHHYLRQHPDIFMPAYRKEPQFFATDLPSIRFQHGLNEYLKLFSEAASESRIGEATTWYLYSKTASRELKTFDPDARIIIMLRHPLETMHSLHNQWLYNGNEDIQDFAQALSCEARRRKGEDLPRKCFFPEGLLYRDVVRFSEQVSRYMDLFGTRNVHVILFEDLRHKTDETYGGLLRFLGVDDEHEPSLGVVNASQKAFFPGLNRFLNTEPARPIGGLIRKVTTQGMRRSIRKRIMDLNTYAHPRRPLDARFRRKLLAEFQGEIRSLSGIIDRDLSGWLCESHGSTRREAPREHG